MRIYENIIITTICKQGNVINNNNEKGEDTQTHYSGKGFLVNGGGGGIARMAAARTLAHNFQS